VFCTFWLEKPADLPLSLGPTIAPEIPEEPSPPKPALAEKPLEALPKPELLPKPAPLPLVSISPKPPMSLKRFARSPLLEAPPLGLLGPVEIPEGIL